MGQKVNPIGLRLGIVGEWSSRWYANRNYSRLVKEDIKIRDFVATKFKQAGIAKVEIERAAKNLKISLYSSRPGIVIGKKGSGADSLKDQLVKLCNVKASELSLNVFEVKRPDLNARLAADSVRQQLERRASFRRAMKKTIAAAIKAGAKGIKIRCSGRLGGADMARVETYREGRVPLHTLRADIDYGTAEAATTFGLIGVKVWIYHDDILDKR